MAGGRRARDFTIDDAFEESEEDRVGNNILLFLPFEL
jgi:hypothetical protein